MPARKTAQTFDNLNGMSTKGESPECEWSLGLRKQRSNPFSAINRRNNGGHRNMKKIGIIMGSDSDFPVVEKAVKTLEEFKVPYEVHIFSAHRTPEHAKDFSMKARENGFGAIIAAAGMAAHLAGSIAANTTIPVIGIPIKSGSLGGMDALLSTVQMPPGIPVATVGIDAAKNAALLAIEILSGSDDILAEKLKAQRASDSKNVLEKNTNMEKKYSC